MTKITTEMKMKALINDKKEKRLRLVERPMPSELDPDEVLCRMVASGVCGTDLKLIEGKISAADGVIMGHESIGDVVAVGKDVDTLDVGDRVVLQPNIVCKNCPNCEKYAGINDIFCLHQTAYGIWIDGGMSEYAKFNHKNLKKLPEGFTSINAALIEPMACLLHGFWRIQNQLENTRNPKILILGAGMIGLLWCRVLQSEGYWSGIHCCDQSEERMAVAVKLGAKSVTTSELEHNTKEEFDLIIDCTGYAPCTTMALDKVAKGGTVLIFGCCAETAKTEIRPFQIYQKEISLVGSIIYETESEFDRAIEYVWQMEQKNLLNMDDFNIGKFQYSNVEMGWNQLMRREIPKLVLIQ